MLMCSMERIKDNFHFFFDIHHCYQNVSQSLFLSGCRLMKFKMLGLS